MYLHISEQARNIIATRKIYQNEMYSIWLPVRDFKCPGVSLRLDIEEFFVWNGKFQLHPCEPLDDLSLLEHRTAVEYKPFWSFWF